MPNVIEIIVPNTSAAAAVHLYGQYIYYIRYLYVQGDTCDKCQVRHNRNRQFRLKMDSFDLQFQTFTPDRFFYIAGIAGDKYKAFLL